MFLVEIFIVQISFLIIIEVHNLSKKKEKILTHTASFLKLVHFWVVNYIS